MKFIYANRIIERADWIENRFTINNVPERWKAETLTELANRRYDSHGLPLVHVA